MVFAWYFQAHRSVFGASPAFFQAARLHGVRQAQPLRRRELRLRLPPPLGPLELGVPEALRGAPEPGGETIEDRLLGDLYYIIYNYYITTINQLYLKALGMCNSRFVGRAQGEGLRREHLEAV